MVATPTWQRSATSSTVALIPLLENTARAAASTSSSVMPCGRAITDCVLRNTETVNAGRTVPGARQGAARLPAGIFFWSVVEIGPGPATSRMLALKKEPVMRYVCLIYFDPHQVFNG